MQGLMHCSSIVARGYASVYIDSLVLIAVSGASWKEKLYIIEAVEERTTTLTAGSYQNLHLTEAG